MCQSRHWVKRWSRRSNVPSALGVSVCAPSKTSFRRVPSREGFIWSIDLEVMLAAVKFDAMQGLCSAADAVGFTVERAMPASLALVNSFRYNYPDLLESVIVVNVGARTTNLLFLEGDRFYVRTLALAGNAVTTSIAESSGRRSPVAARAGA